MIETGADGRAPRPRTRWYGSGTTRIFLGLVLGIAVGYLWPSFGVAVRPLADAFLRLIKMIVAPLIFSTLVTAGLIALYFFGKATSRW